MPELRKTSSVVKDDPEPPETTSWRGERLLAYRIIARSVSGWVVAFDSVGVA